MKKEKCLEICRELAMRTGFSYDEAANVLYAERNGYMFLINQVMETNPYVLNVTTSASSSTMVIGKKEKMDFIKNVKPITNFNQQGNVIISIVGGNKNIDIFVDNVNCAIDSLVKYLTENNFHPCCEICGQPKHVNGVLVGNIKKHICQECYEMVKIQCAEADNNEVKKTPSIAMGLAGAFLGGLLGAIVLAVSGFTGAILTIFGMLIALLTFKGYELFNGKADKKGIIGCCIILAVMTFAGYQMSYAFILAKTLRFGVIEGLQAIPMQMAIGRINSVKYTAGLIGAYFWAFINAYMFIPNCMLKIQNKAVKNRVLKIGNF